MEEKIYKTKIVPIKHPLLQYWYGVLVPFGIALLILGCYFLFGVIHDKNQIENWSREYWNYQKSYDITEGSFAEEEPEDEEYQYIIYNADTFYDKFGRKYNPDRFAEKVQDYYFEKYHVILITLLGLTLAIGGITCGIIYKKGQKEAKKQ